MHRSSSARCSSPVHVRSTALIVQLCRRTSSIHFPFIFGAQFISCSSFFPIGRRASRRSVHVATSYGYSKWSLDLRLGTVESNEEKHETALDADRNFLKK